MIGDAGVLEAALLAAAIGFALVNGLNDGGALASASVRIAFGAPATALALLGAAVALVPLVLGAEVAATLAERLVPFGEPDGTLALLAAVIATVAVVVLLARRGLPTSLTLALVGGVTGAGLGTGLPVAWGTLALVLGAGLVVPVLAGALGSLLVRLLSLQTPRRGAGRRLRAWHVLAFGLVAVAYGANDGQKAVGVLAAAVGAGGAVRGELGILAAAGGLFVVGGALGVRRIGGMLLTGVFAARPLHLVSAELGAATAVLAGAAVGAPVSMTQSLAGSLVGSGVREGLARIRWRAAGRLGLAWVLTLPASGAAAAALGAAGTMWL